MAPATAPVDTHMDSFQLLQLHELVPSTTNPRKHFDGHMLDELAQSIREHGVIAPIIVRPLLPGATFEIVAGERRYRAAQLAGETRIPSIVKDLSDADVLEIQLIENIQRDDLDPLEEAHGYRALIDSSPSKYSAAYIADRIGRSEKFVWDRIKLLDLIPEIKQLLEQARILVGHGELLAKLKPEDQHRAIAVTGHTFGRERSGLWRHEVALEFEGTSDPPTKAEAFRGMKPVTVKELEAWIARHVRFDVAHMAQAAPLDFGPVAEQIAQASAQPGRGRKVISITDDYRVEDDAKDPSERTYGSQSWRRADGGEKSKTCDHRVLGVFVAGPGYGSTLQVCVARDRCHVHFAKEIKEREKNATLRVKGQSAKADARETQQKQQWQIEQEKREAERKAWEAVRPRAIAAITAHVSTMPVDSSFVRRVAKQYLQGKDAEIANPRDLVLALAVRAATQQDWYRDGLGKNAQVFGFNLKKWIADQAPKPNAKPAKATKAAKKAKAKR